MVSFTKEEMCEKIKSDSRHFLWLFLPAVDPQIMIYTEERHAVALLHAQGGQSSNRVRSGSGVQSMMRLSAAEKRDSFAGEPKGRAARLPNNEMGGRKEVVPKPSRDV